ncbi:glycosyl transferase [Methylomonas sp. LWB]|uniref:glycosyltransferase family 2 protein n=1 Tax=Methylomonas sp. LWB TaxID=1905845 RepID=UPI0008D95A78|nr:glycosyltransferase family 2 protein [Methylomonas sp. LWB]OHX36109.1 glycosyl transferase [Methylomonas sp. LWB]
MTIKVCIVIPVYNHERALPALLARLKPHGLPCLLVNDGSSPACGQVLRELAAAQTDWLSLLERPANGGKGAAVVDGFRQALARGFSHALQIDADGQHDTADIPAFLALARLYPDAMILGAPRYGADAPKSRVHGRRITNFWIRINTWSDAIADGMCGFRLYPLAAVEHLLARQQVASGMAFDIDIVVRLYWQGVTALNLPTAVRYPEDGVSHFRLFRDNALISATHARLFFGMLLRLPVLLLRRLR